MTQRDLQDAKIVTIETKKQQLTAIVNAYQALGGGMVRSFNPANFASSVVTFQPDSTSVDSANADSANADSANADSAEADRAEADKAEADKADGGTVPQFPVPQVPVPPVAVPPAVLPPVAFSQRETQPLPVSAISVSPVLFKP